MADPAERMPYRPMPPSAEEQQLAWRARFAARVAVTLLSLALVGLLTLSTVTVVTIRNSQKDGRALVEQITGCTTPGRRCYERAQRQTADAVADINRVTIAAASCGARYPGQTERVRACIKAELAKERRR